MNSKERRRLVREFKPEIAALRAVARLTSTNPDLPYYRHDTRTEHRNAAELRNRHSPRGQAFRAHLDDEALRFRALVDGEARRDRDRQALRAPEEVASFR
jgi:hypothetical protein